MRSNHINKLNTIKIPHVSEKASRDHASGKYVFKVAKAANKKQIKEAVEEMFEVKVGKVTTVNVKGKKKRFGRSSGVQSDWKKAYLTLVEGQIDLFGGE